MHPDLLYAHAEMLPRLAAREDMRMATAVALGTGSLRKPDAQRTWRALQRDARGGVGGRVASPADLAAAGIAVKRVSRSSARPGGDSTDD